MTQETILQTQLELGKASIGKESASLGFKVNREKIDLTKAEQFFCGARLKLQINLDHDADQAKFECMDEAMEGEKIESVVDVKRFSVSPDEITGTLSFVKGEIDTHRLADFAQRTVQVTAERIGDANMDDVDDALSIRKRAGELNDGSDKCLLAAIVDGRCWNGGLGAYEEGAEMEECPYDHGPERDDWLRGFLTRTGSQNHDEATQPEAAPA